MKAKTVKMCDMNAFVAAKVFEMLNPGKIQLQRMGAETVIRTGIEPKNLVYPEGWYYANMNFRNKHQSTTGFYEEIPMIKPNGDIWDEPYCTLDS
ncbi:MAG: hypothetical protein IKG42_01260 [Clostridia bacterium]|nr:hypothetical protein [Clostridia bacterium]